MLNRQTKKNLYILVASAVCAGFSFLSILAFTDPGKAGITVFIFLYLSLFLFLTPVFLATGIALRSRHGRNPTEIFYPSLRQAILLSLAVMIMLYISSQQLLYWWMSGTVVVFFLFIEIFFTLKN